MVRPELRRGGLLAAVAAVDHLVEPLDEGAGQVLRLRRRDVRRYHCNDNAMRVAGTEMIVIYEAGLGFFSQLIYGSNPDYLFHWWL